MENVVKNTDHLGGDRSQFDIDNDFRAYLLSTDWYVVRFNETGEPIPEDVKANRARARAEIKTPFSPSI